ncbi:MAG: replicative DNA helicase [Saprospiraceae bacterium]|nr:replicative DNA helicase [Saprospiraceae bacterium]
MFAPQMAETGNNQSFSQTGNERGKRRNAQGNDSLSNFVFGKVQPQALQLEEAVLGALMLDRDALPLVMDILRPESFYKEGHQMIYRAVVRLFERSNPVDLLTVTEELKKSGELDKAGGAYYLVELTHRVASAANIEYHARIIAQKHIQRELIHVSTNVIRDAYEDTTDVFNLLDDAEKGLFAITQNNLSRSYESMGTLSAKVLKQIEEMTLKGDGLTGVPTGFTDLDRLTSGWQPSDLIIIAARPGMGKTSMVLAVALNAARDFNKGVALFSLEMASTQLVQRLISMEAEISGSKMRNGKLEDYEWQQLQTTVERLSSVPIFIDDTPAINIFELRAKCRRLKQQYDIQLVVIDYLQLMTGVSEGKGGGNREQEIASISRALKSLAKEINVPVIALSQLSRAVEMRGGSKRPQLSDLRESGCLTADTLLVDQASGRRFSIGELANQSHNKWFNTPSLQNDLTIEGCPISNVFFSGRKQVFELKTKSGRRIKATANHPFYRIHGWARLDSLRVGDKIALPRKISISHPSNPLSKEELILLAHLIGDGCILPRQPYHYTSADDSNIEVVCKTASQLFDINARVITQKNWKHAYLPSPVALTHGVKHPITIWYEQLGLERVRSYEKRLPEKIFESDEDHIALFLRHLWSTDGNISRKQMAGKSLAAAIYYASTSLELAEQVQHLLLRLGIWSTLRASEKTGYRKNYQIHISGASQQLLFLQRVGCHGERGQIIPELVAALQAISPNPNTDVIPKEVWASVISPLKEKAGITWRAFQNELQGSYCGSSIFKAGISRERMGKIGKILPFDTIKQLAASAIYWDEILSINALGFEDVYDATIPGTHNFVANDIIVHNSIEQDADIVSFIYRPEYYQILEDENGQSLKGIAEFIIAKHRHGALETVRLKFMDNFAKFVNLDDPAFAGLEAPLAGPFQPSVVTRPSRMNDEDIPF